MYYAHFGLKEPPFKITPNTDVFYTGGGRGAVLDALIYAIQNGEGIIKVVGEVGSGKTMLCRMLQTMLPKHIESIYLANPSVAPEDVLHAIAFELRFRLPKNSDRLKVMQMLQNHLLERHAAGKQVVIFIEEAQGMALETLEQIRLLSNLETNHDKLLQIVLFGQPELDENLNQTNIRQLRERITHSFTLAPFRSEEIGDYLIFRLRAAGYFGPHLFTPKAIKKLSEAAEGLVRRVNILADKALLAAFADNVYQVTPKHIKTAIMDSEFGAEKAKLIARKKNFLIWAGLLLLGLVLGNLASNWHANPIKDAASNVPENTQVKPTVQEEKPVAVEPPSQAVVTSPTPQNQAQLVAPPASVVPEDMLAQRLRITTNWLASQPPSTVSIQLLGASSEEQMRTDLQKIGQQMELDNIYVYRTKVNGQPFLNVLYGSFSNRFEAMQALQKLPAEIQKNHPQLRTIAGVLQEIK
jgi:MSHA biogenesis protein MshM